LTIDEFFKDIEGYYGEYDNKYLKGSIKAYMQKDHKQDKYLEVARAIKYYHRVNFGVPCIASIEDSIKQARLEKGQVDPHKSRATKTNKYNYSESKDPEFDKVNIDLKALLKDKIRRV